MSKSGRKPTTRRNVRETQVARKRTEDSPVRREVKPDSKTTEDRIPNQRTLMKNRKTAPIGAVVLNY